jgi:hypothetical protein
MAKRNPVPFNTGVGRFVGGSCYQGSTLDDKGQPKVYKTGAKAGQPRTDYSVGIALPKTQPHWANEPWGAAIWAEGHAAWPGGQAQRKDFAWKIIDGDSTEPNKKMKRPCDQAGYAGHWVLWFGGTTPPPVAVAVSGPPVWNDQPGTCMPGDYIEIRGSVSSNESDQTAGMYLNIDAVCLRGYHPDGRIASQQIDLATAGFGATPLPAGAVVQPAGNALAPSVAPPPPVPGASPSTPVAPPVPATPAPAPAAPPVPATTPVTPNPAILGAPGPTVAPPAPVPSPVVTPPPAPVAPPAVRTMKNGGDYAAHVAAGWTDEAMRKEGWID